MPNPIAVALLAGLISAGLFLSPITGTVLLAYFVQLPLLFAGFTLGLTGSVVAVASGVLVCGLIASVVAAVIYALVQALPALFVVRQALLARTAEDGSAEWYPPGLLLAQLTAFAAFAVTFAFLGLWGEPGGLKGALEGMVVTALQEFGMLEAGAPPPPEFGRFLFLVPGVIAASWLIMIVANAALAQLLAVRLRWQRRPTPDFGAIQLPWWLWPALGLAAFLSLLGDDGLGFLGRTLLIILIVPYGFVGLAVLHVWARRWSHPGLALAAVYGTIVLFVWPLALVLVLGLVDDWAGLRRRLS